MEMLEVLKNPDFALRRKAQKYKPITKSLNADVGNCLFVS